MDDNELRTCRIIHLLNKIVREGWMKLTKESNSGRLRRPIRILVLEGQLPIQIVEGRLQTSNFNSELDSQFEF